MEKGNKKNTEEENMEEKVGKTDKLGKYTDEGKEMENER